ncbi:MAG: Y-family DNA polymerase [Rhizomicrobium sp.]
MEFSRNRRILALWLARLPTDRLTRRSPAEGALAIAASANNALYIHALNREAERQGLYRGQPLANARAMVERLAVLPADEKQDLDLLKALAQWCERFTPLVAPDPPDGLLLDITGAAHLFGGEERLLAEACARLKKQGFCVHGAVAGSSLAARAFARHAGDIVSPPGEDERLLAPLPIAALDCGEETLRVLRRAGLKTIAQVAGRGRAELCSRLGADFTARLDVMLGMEEKPLSPLRPLPQFRAEQRFAEPITTPSAIEESLGMLALSLGRILEREGQGLRLLEAFFFRADGKVVRLSVRTGAPLRDPRTMRTLLKQKLEALADPLDPGFGFDLIRLEASLAEKTQPGVLSFDEDENARRQIGFLLDRLSARFGATQVERFVPQDTHIPEAQSAAIPAQTGDFRGVWKRQSRAGDPPLRPLRLFARPEEIKAPLFEVPDGPPRRFSWRQARFHVRRAEGPERIAMEWWKSHGVARDYFRVETVQGLRFWLYRDGHDPGFHPKWYLQGIFA